MEIRSARFLLLLLVFLYRNEIAFSSFHSSKISLLNPQDIDWTSVDLILENAIKNRTFPGCVALVANEKGILYLKAHGNYTYGDPTPFNYGLNPPMKPETLFDMASCTKVTATTSAIAQFYQRGQLNLETKIVDILGDSFGQNGKQAISVLNCLLHNAGLPPDPNPNYWDPVFGCPETSHHYPEENFSCQKKIYESVLAQKLQYPIGTQYLYSDLSMITLMFVVGRLARDFKYIEPADLLPSCDISQNFPATDQCYFEAYVRKYVFEKLDMTSSGFLPARSEWDQCAPTENDTSYLNRVIQGQVSDGNAYALGGIAGHAGLFSNVKDLYKMMRQMMFPREKDDSFLNATTIRYFTKEYNHTQSSRALGWNTNDPDSYDYGWNLVCGTMSASTWTHIGFTGTQMCGDPERKLITILLTNRVYPSASGTGIADARRSFNTEVVRLVDTYSSGHNKKATNTAFFF